MHKADSGSLHTPRAFATISDFMAEFGSTKAFLSEKLGVSRFQLNGLLLEDGYQPPVAIFDVRDALADRVAALLNQTPDYVRDFYRKAAA